MPRLSLLGGVGAVGSAMARFFHPSKPIRDKWPHDEKRRLTGVLVTGETTRRIGKKDQSCYVVRIMEIDDSTQFFIVKKNFKVEQAPVTPFESEAPQPPTLPPIQVPAVNDAERSSVRNVVSNIEGRMRVETTEDIADLRHQGIEVDDDNEPAPENVPAQGEAPLPGNGRWEKPTVCSRRANNFQNLAGKFTNHRWDKIADYNELELFRMCFPEEWLVNVCIPMTNKGLAKKVDLQEFYVFLGCIFFMSCYQGIPDREMWWSTKPIDMFDGAPFRLNAYMSRNRFREIMHALRYTDKEEPLFFIDRFHDVRQMIDAFNKHYEREYQPSWLSCIDESMSSWLNKFCPGFMTVPRKPHPFGNEYHSIADGDDGKAIMWRVKLVEGKDRPKKPDGNWAYPSKWEQRGYTKTVTLLLEMTEPIHGSGKVVSGDSGFCVTQGVLALDKLGVKAQFLVKKRKYWPKMVPGDYIDDYMKDKPLGYSESFVQVIDGTPFYIHCTRDSTFITKIMSTHGILDEIQEHVTWRLVDGTWKSFHYTEPLSRHNRSKHWVDDVNNRRHDPIALEDGWATKWWPNRQFTFILSVAEANAVQARARGKKEPAMPTLEFRRQLAMKMMTNTLGNTGAAVASPRRTRASLSNDHVLSKRAKKEGKWNPTTRKFNEVTTLYVARPCSGCRTNTRDYCSCDPGQDLCQVCFGKHLQEHGG